MLGAYLPAQVGLELDALNLVLPAPRAGSMPKKDIIEAEGEVIETLPNAYFRVKLDGHEEPILAVISGKMRKYFIKILPGDRVKVEMSKHDLTLGRVVYRYK